MKKTKISKQNSSKETHRVNYSSEDKRLRWRFNRIDRSGPFAFDINREDFQHKDFLSKMISYSTMTWRQIQSQTHDNGKSKNHFLEYHGLSKEARDRIDKLDLKEETDSVFSIAFNNKLRLIGIIAIHKNTATDKSIFLFC